MSDIRDDHGPVVAFGVGSVATEAHGRARLPYRAAIPAASGLKGRRQGLSGAGYRSVATAAPPYDLHPRRPLALAEQPNRQTVSGHK